MPQKVWDFAKTVFQKKNSFTKDSLTSPCNIYTSQLGVNVSDIDSISFLTITFVNLHRFYLSHICLKMNTDKLAFIDKCF